MKRDSIVLTVLISLLLIFHFFLFVRNDLCLISNTGFAFSIGTELSVRISFILSAISIVLVILLFKIFKEVKREYLVFVLILSMGNILDRIFGGVCDYIKISSFPIFNLLDIGIMFFLAIIFIDIIRNEKNRVR